MRLKKIESHRVEYNGSFLPIISLSLGTFFSKQQIVDQAKDMGIPVLYTCHDAISYGPRFRRSTLFHVAVRTLVLWNIHIRLFIFHCGKHILANARVILCDHCLASDVCGWLSHRNSSSDLALPPSICAASSSSCFQPPVVESKKKTKTNIVVAGESLPAQAFLHLSNICQIQFVGFA